MYCSNKYTEVVICGLCCFRSWALRDTADAETMVAMLFFNTMHFRWMPCDTVRRGRQRQREREPRLAYERMHIAEDYAIRSPKAVLHLDSDATLRRRILRLNLVFLLHSWNLLKHSCAGDADKLFIRYVCVRALMILNSNIILRKQVPASLLLLPLDIFIRCPGLRTRMKSRSLQKAYFTRKKNTNMAHQKHPAV